MGHSKPPNTNESRQSIWMASRCGWWRLWAIFSGSTCTIQNSTIAPMGTKMMMNQARPIAAVSIISGGRNEACAGGAAIAVAMSAMALHNFRGWLAALSITACLPIPRCWVILAAAASWQPQLPVAASRQIAAELTSIPGSEAGDLCWLVCILNPNRRYTARGGRRYSVMAKIR